MPRRLRLLVLLVATAAALLAPTAAHAAAGWQDGSIKYTYDTDCPSQIQGYPYQESELGAWTGVYEDPSNLPKVGQVFYVRVIVGGIGDPCAGPYAHIELLLNDHTHLAISPDFPVKCYSQFPNQSSFQQFSNGCPTTATPSRGRYGYDFDSTQGPWPLARGSFIQIQVPVYVTAPQHGIGGSSFQGCGDCVEAAVQAIDGDLNGIVNPSQYLNVDAAEPAVGFPDPWYSFATTTVTTTAYEFNYFTPGKVFALLVEDQNHDCVAQDAEPTAGISPQINASADDYAFGVTHTWSNLKPNTDYVYELGFEPDGASTYLVSPDRCFHTPSTFTGTTSSASNSPTASSTNGVHGVPPSSTTKPPPSQAKPPLVGSSNRSTQTLQAGGGGHRKGGRKLIALPKSLSLKKLRHGIKLRFFCAAACKVSLKLHLRGGRTVVASGSGKRAKKGTGTLTLRLTRAGKRTFRRGRHPHGVLNLGATLGKFRAKQTKNVALKR